ncbi:MAG TPA: DUF4097 family beta strand repeat-containing protein [Gemmatimonadaceae bacterium]|nr:DUF4097 family beta strand repeat-containing protein [Gemmatimonadaceae bacterium]
MRRNIPVALIIACAAPLTAQSPSSQPIDRGWAVAPTASIRFSGSVGRLRIIGWDRDSLAVVGTVPVGARFEAGIASSPRAGERPASAKMYLEAADDAVASTATLEFRVPRRSRVWVKSGTADVELRDFEGGADLNVIGGRVVVVGSPRELQVGAMDADVDVKGSPNWLRVKTATGTITVRGGSTDAALATVSGGIRLEGAGGALERARFETVSGPISVNDIVLARSADVVIDSHSGAVNLVVPPGTDFEIAATSVVGSIENRFDARRPLAGREGRGAELNISRGSGGARITIGTFKGTITLTAP